MNSKQQTTDERRAKLEAIQAAIRAGSLRVRQMTAQERERYPPRPAGDRGRTPGRRPYGQPRNVL
jgi:hypothetical protein